MCSQLVARMGNSVQYRQNRPLTDDEIRRHAPSVFAADKHESRSERYAYIPTLDVLNGLRKEGFEPYAVAQGRSRIPGKAEFTKHMLRLRHAGQQSHLKEVGDEVNEIVLINSHDGTSSYQMMGGVFRLACTNGLIVCKETLEDVRVKHSGKVQDEVVQGAFQVLDGFNLIREVTHDMKALTLSRDEQQAFADSALILKYDDEPAPIEASQLLRTRRLEDRDASLWTTFNKVQENVIRGGLAGHSANGRRMRTREVQAIDTDVKLNRAMWLLAERMKQLKAA